MACIEEGGAPKKELGGIGHDGGIAAKRVAADKNTFHIARMGLPQIVNKLVLAMQQQKRPQRASFFICYK